MTDLHQRDKKPISDKHIIPIVTVFDDLKDYLSDSDLSLDYRIAKQRRKQKNMKNSCKPSYLSNPLTSEKKPGEKQERSEKKADDESRERDILPRSVTCPPSRSGQDSTSCVNISQNVNWRNGQHQSGHKESLLENEQENDCAVRKINSKTEVRRVGTLPGESENVLSNVNISRVRGCQSEGQFSSQTIPSTPSSGEVGTSSASSFSNIFQAKSRSGYAVSRTQSECSLAAGVRDLNYNKLTPRHFSPLTSGNQFSDLSGEKFRNDECYHHLLSQEPI